MEDSRARSSLPNASGHRTERAKRAPVRCTALLARDAKHPQDLVPVAAERHTHWAIIDLCSPVLQPDTPQSVQPYVAEVSNIIVDKDMSADLVTHLLLAGVVRRYDLPDGKRKTHSLEPLSSVGNAMQPSVSDDEHISNDCEGTKRVCSVGDFRCCQGALTFVHVVVHFLIWTFPNERHAISAIALPRLYVAAHMCLDPLHCRGIGIRNRAVVIYRDDQSCTHPGPFWLTPRLRSSDSRA